jgi:N-acetylglutamate synthase-like GNAT family acetyltransferase
VSLRAAEPSDVGALLELINRYAESGLLLRRSEASLRARLADFVVAVAPGAGRPELVGCGALTRLAPGLGELRSLAVRAHAAGRGVGRGIVAQLLRRARRRGLVEVLALTRRPSFFQALGFVPTRRERFQAKVQADCRGCPMSSCCDEVAMLRGLQGATATGQDWRASRASFESAGMGERDRMAWARARAPLASAERPSTA